MPESIAATRCGVGIWHVVFTMYGIHTWWWWCYIPMVSSHGSSNLCSMCVVPTEPRQGSGRNKAVQTYRQIGCTYGVRTYTRHYLFPLDDFCESIEVKKSCNVQLSYRCLNVHCNNKYALIMWEADNSPNTPQTKSTSKSVKKNGGVNPLIPYGY